MNRVSIVCLGVRDMARAILFYRDGLGFRTDVSGDDVPVVFFKTGGTVLELYRLDLLAEDAGHVGAPAAEGVFGGITLAHNVKSEAEVREVIEQARAAGAVITKEPQPVFWDGCHAYFRDPDGYYWEVAYGPDFKFDENDMLII